MNMHCQNFGAEHAGANYLTNLLGDVHPAIPRMARGLQRQRRFDWLPYGYVTEPDGAFLIFDRKTIPLCRKRPNGDVEVVAQKSGAPIIADRKRVTYLHFTGHDHPCESEATVRKLIAAVHRLGIEAEIFRRYQASYKRRLESRRAFQHLARCA